VTISELEGVISIEQSSLSVVDPCTEMFDAEGSGLEFVAYDAHEVEVQRDNPFLSRTEMFRIMTRSLDLYRRRYAGRSPHRVMVHGHGRVEVHERDTRQNNRPGGEVIRWRCKRQKLQEAHDHWPGSAGRSNSVAAEHPTNLP
jgi:hypothetical protein